eukprot:gene52353-26360_t
MGAAPRPLCAMLLAAMAATPHCAGRVLVLSLPPPERDHGDTVEGGGARCGGGAAQLCDAGAGAAFAAAVR